ncbi:C4-dicarboxylate ABC transporter permease [Sporosarcina sp. NCCP-2222]|uniref:TRAP transporter small permease n=1 Tax=Sporosarcina sp. NCCP-2222 TaxID=2935073 RepID=UPI002082B245|nr:TRAP transporter small permease [Sporosarcina sp. NCCP-2222]GKV56808.1 C4-dicarboxylate ABC transporter permease [Sporosarcina sp. NCCP-2222]
MERVISKLEEWIVAIVLSIMSTIAFVNILSRGFASYSFSFTEEVTVNLFVMLTFVGTAIGVREHAHLGFTLLYDMANAAFKRVISVLVGLMMLLLFGVLLYFGIQMVQFQMDMGQKTPSLGWPQWWFSLAMPLGALLCIYRTVQVTIKELRGQDEKGEQLS